MVLLWIRVRDGGGKPFCRWSLRGTKQPKGKKFGNEQPDPKWLLRRRKQTTISGHAQKNKIFCIVLIKIKKTDNITLSVFNFYIKSGLFRKLDVL